MKHEHRALHGMRPAARRCLALLTSLALALALTPCTAAPAMAATTAASTSSYTVTIPSSLAVARSGWNATAGISTSGALVGEKLTVTASSANSWALRSGGDSVGYRLASSDGGAQVTSWEFDSLGGAARPLGVIVENYDTKPAGAYKDTVTFAAAVKRIPVASVTLNNTSTRIVVGNSTALTASVAPANAYNRSVSWTSSNASVATVDSAGKVTAVAPGTATVTATANDGSGVKASCTVTVVPSIQKALQQSTNVSPVVLAYRRPDGSGGSCSKTYDIVTRSTSDGYEVKYTGWGTTFTITLYTKDNSNRYEVSFVSNVDYFETLTIVNLYVNGVDFGPYLTRK